MIKKTDGRFLKGEARREHLIEVALKVFADLGFARATIKDLGVASGMSPALLYHYFKNKEELLQAVVERYSFVNDLRGLAGQGDKLPTADFLKMFAHRFYDLIGERQDLVRIFLKEGSTNETVAAAWRGLLEQGFPILQGYFERQVNHGNLKPHHTEVTVRSLGTTIVMLRMTEIVLPPKTVTGYVFIDEFIDNLLNGIKPDNK